MDHGWIRVSAPLDSPIHGMLQSQLHQGEAEAIALAAGLSSDLVLIDELEGRRLAAAVKLKVSGTLGILRRAKASGVIPIVRQAVGLLRRKAGFFIAHRLESNVLIEAGESE